MKEIKSSTQDSVQKSLLKFVKLCEISLSKIEFKIVKIVQTVKIASLKIVEKHYYIKPWIPIRSCPVDGSNFLIVFPLHQGLKVPNCSLHTFLFKNFAAPFQRNAATVCRFDGRAHPHSIHRKQSI